jgi:rfaE bifunctional protein nucleotidyltransferase chain/domain
MAQAGLLRIGFTNGCFDILHPGHVKVLTAARGACDRLIVGLNSDASVKRLKGEGRPVQDERARAEVLAALEAVDLVVIFEEDTPIEADRKIKPSVLVKGGDYTREQVVGHEVVEADGGRCCWSISCPGSVRPRWSIERAEARRERAVETIGAGIVARAMAGSGRLVHDHGCFAILLAFSLPWSTTLVAIFAPRFLVSMVPFLDAQGFLQSLKRPICAAPDCAFCALALLERCGRMRLGRSALRRSDRRQSC